MEIDQHLGELPLTKSKPDTLLSVFGREDIIPMWVADMEFPIAQSIQEALINRVSDSGFGYEYKPDTFFNAQKNWYETMYNIDLNRSHVLYSPTITTTLSILMEQYTDEGDGIIIQPPVFMEFGTSIRRTKRRIIKNPLKLTDNHYQIDFNDLREKAKEPNNKVLIICNPHNPVGRVWKKEELDQIVNICKENSLILVSDEIHKDIILFDNKFTSLLSYQDIYDNIVVCTSEAKTFNLCGITDSMAIISNDDIRNSISRALNKYNLGRTNALTRVALEAAYREGQPWLKEVIFSIEENVEIIESELVESPINLLKPEGTYQVWLDFRNVYTNTKTMFTDITKKSGIGMNAGHWFGREGALFMRMNIATSKEKITAAIKSVKQSVIDISY